MKLIIAGSRHMTQRWTVYEWADSIRDMFASAGIPDIEVISGCQDGADTLGEEWAHSRSIDVERFEAAWAKFGRAAGPQRNRLMSKVGDFLLAFPEPSSTGTVDMIKKMHMEGKPYLVVPIPAQLKKS